MKCPPSRPCGPLCVISLAFALVVTVAPPAAAQADGERKLHFPEITRKAMGDSRYFSIVYDAPVVHHQTHDLNRIHPKARIQNSPLAEAYFLGERVLKVAALLDPREDDPFVEGALGWIWLEELDNAAKPELFESSILSAMHSAPKVLTCTYSQFDALPAELTSDGGFLGDFLNVNISFWTAPPPAELAPARLLDFAGSATGMHPLIVIGPAQTDCPPTLGLALEAIAEQFPGRVPSPISPEPALAVTTTQEPEPDDTEINAVIPRLLGMSVTTTRTSPWGDDVDRDFMIVDALDPTGPAARAGFRSGDYIGSVGWTWNGTPTDFATTLTAREAERAAVLSRLLPGQEDPTAHLVVFANEAKSELVQMPRTADVPTGWTLLDQTPWSTFLVKGEEWCVPHIEARNAMDIDADDLVLNSVFDDALARVVAECPVLESIAILNLSSKVGAPINILRGSFRNGSWNVPFDKLGIDGLPPGATVTETRAIAEQNAPECDRLAAHSRDPMRRYGLPGVEFIPEGQLEAALNACIAATDAAPHDGVALFQLGRVLYEGGVHDAALAALREAADLRHGGAHDYLGRMYLAGEGVPQDTAEAKRHFHAAMTAGFQALAQDDPAVIELENVTMSRLIGEAFNLSIGMRAAGDPAYADQNIPSEYAEPGGRSFVAFLAMEISQVCGTEDALERMREMARADPSEFPDVEHAIHLFGNRMPEVVSLLSSAIEPERRAMSVGAGQSVTALLERHDCLSPQIRQLVMNISEKLIDERGANPL